MSSADLNVRFVPEADIEVLCIAEPMVAQRESLNST